MASLSLSTLRSSVCAEPASSRTRSSKVNISVLMRSAASRFCFFQRGHEAGFGLPVEIVEDFRHHLVGVAAAGLRQARHEFGAKRLLDALQHLLLHRFHLQHAADDVEREVLGQDGKHARRMLGPELGQHDGDGLRIFVLEIVRQHLFLHVGELLPHVAAGGAADLVHDAADALRRQVLLQQPLGGVVVAEQRARGRQPADEFAAAGFRPDCASTVPSVDITIESWRRSSSSSSAQIFPPCVSPSASMSTAARSGPVSCFGSFGASA